ncbi:ATP-binding cassette domain-containing protein [Gemella bergeri]
MKLKIKNLSKSFGKKKILSNISFSVENSEVVAVIGRNGSGKTTLFKLIAGIYDLKEGEMFIDETDLQDIKNEIIYSPDKFNYFENEKIKNIIRYYELSYPKFSKEYFIAEIEKNKIDLDTRVSELSKGQKAILSVILSFSCKTCFVLLDEPFDGIDVLNINLIIDYIIEAQENGVGILISSHQLAYIENISNKIIYLDNKDYLTKEVNPTDYIKYQLVYKEEIPQNLLQNENIAVINNIGRVYTVITYGDNDKLIKDSGALQYDKLPVTLEDIFILRNREGR